MSEIEESLKRISAHEGVLGVAILDDSGKLARSVAHSKYRALRALLMSSIKSRCRYTLPQDVAEKYGASLFMLQGLARTCVRDIDPQVSCRCLAVCAACSHAVFSCRTT